MKCIKCIRRAHLICFPGFFSFLFTWLLYHLPLFLEPCIIYRPVRAQKCFQSTVAISKLALCKPLTATPADVPVTQTLVPHTHTHTHTCIPPFLGWPVTLAQNCLHQTLAPLLWRQLLLPLPLLLSLRVFKPGTDHHPVCLSPAVSVSRSHVQLSRMRFVRVCHGHDSQSIEMHYSRDSRGWSVLTETSCFEERDHKLRGSEKEGGREREK